MVAGIRVQGSRVQGYRFTVGGIRGSGLGFRE